MSLITSSASGNRFSYCHSCLLVAGVWCYAAVFAVGPLSGWGEYGAEPYGTACCIDWYAPSRNTAAMSYIICLFFFCYVVPCTVIFLSYLFILLTVRGSRQAVQQHMSPQNKITNAHALIVKVRDLLSKILNAYVNINPQHIYFNCLCVFPVVCGSLHRFPHSMESVCHCVHVGSIR